MSKYIIPYHKETDNTSHVWDIKVGRADYRLYVPKWRVPDLIPPKIKITVYDFSTYLKEEKTFTRKEVEANPDLRFEPIYARVERVEECTETIHFKPIKTNKTPEVGHPYIPFRFLPHKYIEKVLIKVEWIF